MPLRPHFPHPGPLLLTSFFYIILHANKNVTSCPSWGTCLLVTAAWPLRRPGSWSVTWILCCQDGAYGPGTQMLDLRSLFWFETKGTKQEPHYWKQETRQKQKGRYNKEVINCEAKASGTLSFPQSRNSLLSLYVIILVDSYFLKYYMPDPIPKESNLSVFGGAFAYFF